MPSSSRLITIGSNNHCFLFHKKASNSVIVAVLVVVFSRLFTQSFLWLKLLGKVLIIFRIGFFSVGISIFVEFEL